MIELSADIPQDARVWRNDYRIWKWCRQNTFISAAEHQDWLYKIHHDSSIKMFGVESSNQPVGVCGLTSIDRLNQSAEFSLYIAPKYQKMGFGKEALKALIEHGFLHFNLNRIWGETFDGNPALSMFYKLGIRAEGQKWQAYYREGKFIDAILVSILREEYLKNGSGE